VACCLIQTAAAQPANIATNLGAVISNGGESIKLESGNKSILSVTQTRQPNINLRTEQAATLAGISKNTNLVANQSAKNGAANVSKDLPKAIWYLAKCGDYIGAHWWIQPLSFLVSVIFGYLITPSRLTKKAEPPPARDVNRDSGTAGFE
jgi:hypothetical protein